MKFAKNASHVMKSILLMKHSLPALPLKLPQSVNWMTAQLATVSVARSLRRFRRRILMRFMAEMISTNLGSLTLSNALSYFSN